MANQQIGVELVVVGLAGLSRAMRTAQDDLDRTAASIKKVSGVSADLGSAMTTLGGNMQRVGRAMLIDLSVPLGILTGAMINAGIQFEDAFAGIGKTVGGVSVGFQEIKTAAQRELGIAVTTMDEARDAAKQMGIAFGDLTPVGVTVRNEFRQMALEVPMASNELAKLGEIVGQLGIEAPEIASVTKLVAELGLTTNMSAEDAAMSLIRMANIMRSTVGPDAISMTEFIKRAGSALVDLGNKSVATESEIMNFALRLSAAGDMAKMSEQDVLAWATTLADLGARAESGGTAVSRALENMIIAVQSGSKELGLFASIAGMSGAQFTKLFREDASTALGLFTQKLKEAFEAGKINKDMLTALGLGGVRAFDILGRLGNAQELLAKNTTNANKAWEEAVALEEEAEKRFNTFKSTLQILKNTFTDLGISIFDLVEGDLKTLVGYVKDAINWFKGLDDGLKKNIIIIAAIAAVIGPLLIVFGGLISMLGTAVTAITALGSAALPVIAILGALLATAGLAAGISLGNQPAKTGAPEGGAGSTQEVRGPGAEKPIKTPLQVFLDRVSFNETMDSLKANVKGILSSFDSLQIPDVIKESGLLDTITRLGTFFKESGIGLFSTALDNIKVAADGFTISFREIVEKQGPNIKQLFADLALVGEQLQPMFESLGNAFNMVFGKINWSQVGTALGDLAGFSFEVLIKSLDGLVLIIGVLIKAVTILAPKVADAILWFSNLQTAANDLGIQIREGLLTAWQGMLLNVSTFVLDFIGKFGELKDGVVAKLTEFVASVKKFFNDLYDDLIGNSIITDMLTDILLAFTNNKDSILGIIGELIVGITDAFSGIGSTVGNSLKGLFSGGGGGGGQATTNGEEAPAGGEGSATSGMFDLQNILALQEAIGALSVVWATFGNVVSTTLMSINQVLASLTSLSTITFANMALAFTGSFVLPVSEDTLVLSMLLNTSFLLLSIQWRDICLGMVKSWLDFTANAAKLTPGFVDGVIGEFQRLRNNSSGQINLIAQDFAATFAAGGGLDIALNQFGSSIDNISGKFPRLASAVRATVAELKAQLKTVCDAAAAATNCVEGSPELKLQHPFELFEKYLKGVSYGDLITKATAMPALANVSTVIPNLQGNVTNIDRSITSTITGMPMNTAEDIADTMLRQVRMGEVMQGA